MLAIFRRLSRYLWLRLITLLLLLCTSIWFAAFGLVDTEKRKEARDIGYQQIADRLSQHIFDKQYPDHLRFEHLPAKKPLKVNYTFNNGLQHFIQNKLKRYNPDFGIVVVINPHNGKILAMVDSARDEQDDQNYGNMAVRGHYPAASISKIITAIAAINEGIASASTIIPFNGKSTTLYKKNVFRHKNNKWSRHYSLTESFAKSVNSVFGRLGAIQVGGQTMVDYAKRLGFNNRFASDFIFESGTITIDPQNSWQVAEMASGFTRNNQLSPLHAASLGAIVGNGGELVAPMLVDSIIDPNGVPVYALKQPAKNRVISVDTAKQLRKLMKATIKIGSARKPFRKINRGALASVEIGGKTGSISGFNPDGKYDWFVGYAHNDKHSIAFSVLCINKEKWYVKSPQLARDMIEFYFKNEA